MAFIIPRAKIQAVFLSRRLISSKPKSAKELIWRPLNPLITKRRSKVGYLRSFQLVEDRTFCVLVPCKVGSHNQLAHLLEELRLLSVPYDVQKLWSLLLALKNEGQPDLSQKILLLYHLQRLGFYSLAVCTLLQDDLAKLAGQLQASDWVLILPYFASSGLYCEELYSRAKLCVAEHLHSLQLHQLEGLVTALAHYGHLDSELGGKIISRVSPALQLLDKELVFCLALALASAEVEDPRFYQRILRYVAPLTAHLTTAHRCVQCMVLLDRAAVSEAHVAVKLIQGIDPSLDLGQISFSSLVGMVSCVYRASLQQELLLLDSRRVLESIAKAAISHVEEFSLKQMAQLSSTFGYMSLSDPSLYEALWLRAVEDRTAWECALETAGHERRSFSQLAWGCCVVGLHLRNEKVEASLHETIRRILQNTIIGDPSTQRIEQQLRQLAICHQEYSRADCSISEKWLMGVSANIFFARKKNVQTRVLRLWVKGLEEKGATCYAACFKDVRPTCAQNVLDSSKPETLCNLSQAPYDTIAVRLPLPAEANKTSSAGRKHGIDGRVGMPSSMPADKYQSQEISSDVHHDPGSIAFLTIWAKHPVLVAACRGDQTRALFVTDGPPNVLNGFEVVHARINQGRRLLFLGSDVSRLDVSRTVEEFLARCKNLM